jgi:catechol 2,3-dioxygenase-like lactoylglutathione lyase family enzyme
MAFQVDTVFVWVTDLDRSVEWYAALGIEPGPRYGAWQNMAVNGQVQFALHEGDRPQGRATGAVAFRVDDLDAQIDRLARLGIESTDDETTDTGVARFTTFSDPDGNDIQLLERT